MGKRAAARPRSRGATSGKKGDQVAEVRPRFRWGAVGAATFAPLTVAELKTHLRVDNSDEDALIASLGEAARDYVERHTSVILCSRSFYLEADGFPSERNDIVLPIGPVTAVTQVGWRPVGGDTVQVGTVNTDYRASSNLTPLRIRLPVLKTEWPRTEVATDAVQITVVAGYASAAEVPEMAKHAIRLMVGHWYENREAVVNGTISTDVKFTVEALLGTMKQREMLL
jgi:uncharacterized phiE125 gp8 family phage protein